jgi:D-alanine-D-alanine ligase
MKIGLAYNSKTEMKAELESRGIPVTDDALEEYDSDETIQALVEGLGFDENCVRLFGWGAKLVENLNRYKPDLVFNIAEGFGGRSREAQVPALLEMLGIPYVGSDALALSVSLDKQATKDMVKSVGLNVPKGFVTRRTGMDVVQERRQFGFDFPLIVKPTHEGSSRGVHLDSIVNDDDQLRAKVKHIEEAYGQPALVEEYIWGPEVTVGIVGDPPEIFGVMEIAPKDPEHAWPLYSLEVKRHWRELVEYRTPAQLEPGVLRMIEQHSLVAFQALGCKDMARMDYRIRKDGRPFFLEINPLPGLNPQSSDLCIMAGTMGVGYQDLIRRIVSGATSRYGIRTDGSRSWPSSPSVST